MKTAVSRKLSWDEVQIYSRLVADFYERNGRDPNAQETDRIVQSCRTISHMAALQ